MGNEILPFGSTEQRLQIESAVNESGRMLTPYGGLDAMNALARYDAITKEALASVKKSLGDKQYETFIKEYGGELARRRNSVAKVATEEARHGYMVAVKNGTDAEIRRIAERDIADSTASTLNQANDAGDATTAFNSGIGQADGFDEHQKHQIDRSETLDEDDKEAAKGAVGLLTTASKTQIATSSKEAMEQIDARCTEQAKGQVAPYITDVRKLFLRRYKSHLALGQSSEVAEANALEATRAASITYFKERLGRGQTKAVIAMLDEIERHNDESFDKSLKVAKGGVYDPSNLAFLHHSDITALRNAATSQIEEQRVLRNRQLIESQRGIKLKEQTLLDDITRHAIGVADDGSTPLYGSEEERVKAQRELYDRAAALKKEADAVGYSTRNVFKALSNEPRKYLAMKERSERLARKALGQQYVAEQEKMVEDEILNLAKSATKGGQVEIDVPVRDEQTGKEGTVKMKVDVHRAIVDAIDCARANGLCKGKQFTMMRNQHASSKRYMQMIEDVANKYFSFGIESSMMGNDGKWTGRAAGSTTRIFLSEADGDSFRADNVRANMRVKVALKGRKADTDEGFFDTTDRYVNSDTLNQIIKASKEYLDSKLNPTMEDLDTVFGRAIREAIDKENIKSFQGDTLDTVRRHFDQVFQDHEETFGVWRNGPSTTFFGAPVGSWNQGGQTQRITVAGERRWQDVRDIIPLTQRIRNRRLRDAMIDAQYDESQGRGIDEQIKDLLDEGDTDQE